MDTKILSNQENDNWNLEKIIKIGKTSNHFGWFLSILEKQGIEVYTNEVRNGIPTMTIWFGLLYQAVSVAKTEEVAK